MTILSSIDVPGATAEQYDRVNEILGIEGESNLPEGLIVHICAVDADGVHVRDVWESEEALGQFFDERLGAALAQAGVEGAQAKTELIHGSIPAGVGRAPNTLLEIVVDGGPELYDEITESMGAFHSDQHPSVMHSAAITDDGKMHIVDVWESPEAFGSFAAQQLAPVFGDRMGEIEPRFTPVHNLSRGPAKVTA